MAPIWNTGSHSMSWPVALVIIYGVLFLVTAALATCLAYHGETPYAQMSERHRNRRWIRPLLPMIFILLPALLWPVIMVSMGLFIIGSLIFDKQDGIWKNMRGVKAKKDVEAGHATDEGALNAQASSRLNPSVTGNSGDVTNITEPPPAYTPYDARRGQP